jgi:large subunit ribosomal protein L12
LWRKHKGENKMQYLYSALLLHKADQEINEKALTKVLKAAGVVADDARVKSLVAALGEIDIEEALATAVMTPSAAPSAAPAASASTTADAVEEEEEEEEEGEVIDDDEGLGSLFG